jgi:hypothetical protein
MPILALLAACEKSIIEAETKSLSMISLFTRVKLTITADPPPTNAVVPKEWSIVTGWEGKDDDEGKDFVQCLSVLLPDGKPFIENNRMNFNTQNDKRYHIASKILAFPMGQVGKCKIEVWAEWNGKPVTEKSHIYVRVEHEVANYNDAQKYQTK